MSQVSAHGRSTINPHFHHTGRLPSVLGAYSVQQLKEAGLIIIDEKNVSLFNTQQITLTGGVSIELRTIKLK